MKKIFSMLLCFLITKSFSLAVTISIGPNTPVASARTPIFPIIIVLLEWAVYIGLFIFLIFIISNHLIKKHKNKSMEDESIKQENDKLINKKTRIRLCIFGVIVFCYFAVECILTMVWSAAKPIIYIYPEKTQEVTVELGKPEKLTCTYPKYENGWKVIASPNGSLIDVVTGRNYYALYWEGNNFNKINMSEGFVVKKEDTVKFLEEKLDVLGLNEREANEFIIYWLPKLEKSKYNFIRFETLEDIEKNMPLNISPKPDNIIRVMMQFKGMNREITVVEQELKTPSRDGFTVVEWGGTEY